MGDTEKPGACYWSLIDPWWLPLNETWDDDPEPFLSNLRHVPERARNLYAAHWCQSEVCNGGFHQFFGNTTGILAPEALVAYRAIGLTEWADIVAAAMSVFGDQYPRERNVRELALPSPEAFDQLNSRFFKWLHEERNRWCHAADAYAIRA